MRGKRVTIDFSGDALEALDYIARELGVCRIDALLKTIALMRFVAKEHLSGARILFVNEKERYIKQIVQL